MSGALFLFLCLLFLFRFQLFFSPFFSFISFFRSFFVSCLVFPVLSFVLSFVLPFLSFLSSFFSLYATRCPENWDFFLCWRVRVVDLGRFFCLHKKAPLQSTPYVRKWRRCFRRRSTKMRMVRRKTAAAPPIGYLAVLHWGVFFVF